MVEFWPACKHEKQQNCSSFGATPTHSIYIYITKNSLSVRTCEHTHTHTCTQTQVHQHPPHACDHWPELIYTHTEWNTLMTQSSIWQKYCTVQGSKYCAQLERYLKTRTWQRMWSTKQALYNKNNETWGRRRRRTESFYDKESVRQNAYIQS